MTTDLQDIVNSSEKLPYLEFPIGQTVSRDNIWAIEGTNPFLLTGDVFDM